MGFLDRITRAVDVLRDDSVYSTGVESVNTGGIAKWVNAITKLGEGSHDKSIHTAFAGRPELPDAEKIALYKFSGLGQRIIDLAPNDASRKGYELTTEDPTLGEDIRAYLQNIPVFINTIIRDRGALRALTWGEKLARITRGAALLLIINDGGTLDQPLNTNRIQSIESMRVLTHSQLKVSTTFGDDDVRAGTVEMWEVSLSGTRGGASTMVHSDRIIALPGVRTPPSTSYSTTVSSDDGDWGISLFDVVYTALQGTGVSEQIADNLIQESTMGVWKIRGLQQAIADGNGQQLKDRVSMAKLAMSTLRVLVLDADGEDYSPISSDWKGIAEMLKNNPVRVSAVTGYPISLLYGTYPGGLNTGSLEGDRSNYYETVVNAGIQEDKWRAPVERLVDLTLLAADGPGSPGDEYDLVWLPIAELTELEEATLRKTQAETDGVYIDKGVVTADEVRQLRFGGRDYSTETRVEGPAPTENTGEGQ